MNHACAHLSSRISRLARLLGWQLCLMLGLAATTFPALADSITLTSPNGGETWETGTIHNITWTWSGAIGSTVYMDISRDGGATWYVLEMGTANDGVFDWRNKELASPQCRIRISSSSNPEIFDISDADFTITTSGPAIAVNSPNGGEYWTVGSTQVITWSSLNLAGNVSIGWSTNDGQDFTLLASDTENDGLYIWTVENTPGTECRIQVASVDNPAIEDVSNGNFTIGVGGPSITLTAPNGGESWETGTIHNITWTWSGAIGSTVYMDISRDGGATWYVLEMGTANDGVFDWRNMELASPQCRIRISSSSNPEIFDISDADFTITTSGPAIAVNSPNGGEYWTVGSTQEIIWSSLNLAGNVSIGWSTNDGQDFTLLASDTFNDGSYIWTVEDTPGTQCRIQVSSVDNPAIEDVSNGNFTILEETDVLAAVDSPEEFQLAGNYPNPFNPTTTIEFSLMQTEDVSLVVRDLSGRTVATLVNGLVAQGSHRVTFVADGLPSGVYFYTLNAAGVSSTRMMVLVK